MNNYFKAVLMRPIGVIFIPCVLLFYGTAVLADFERFSFAMPFTGQKGSQYNVELEFINGTESFHIPGDCQKITSRVGFGAPNPVNLIDRKLWLKAINDCKYVAMMHINEGTVPEQDFVSQYDFFNAKLVDLPFASRCNAADPDEFEEKCAREHDGKLTIRTFFPFMEYIEDPLGVNSIECQFSNGVFRGYLVRTTTGIRCLTDRRARGLRLISVDYSDLNTDGYMDVLLRIIPLGRGVSRFPILLPLTRKSTEEPFSLCEGVAFDYSQN